MFRKDLLELLRIAPRSVAGIAAQLELEPRDVEDDLRHRLKSVRPTGDGVTLTPARCRHCGFTSAPTSCTSPASARAAGRPGSARR